MAKKLNKSIKTLDASVRLVLGGRKKASVIITQGGNICSTGLDAAAPTGLPLPKGVYQGEQLLAVSDTLKYCAKVDVTHDQTEAGWRIVLFDPDDADARVYLDWQDCAEPEVDPPLTTWKVDKDQLKMLKAAYTMAQALKKSQLRLVRLQPQIGVLSYLSPTTVAQWWNPDWIDETGYTGADVDIEVADIKRAVLYRGAKLIAIGTSNGKINFAFDDGAFLRTDKYDGDTYDETELMNVFTFDEGSYAWPLGAEQPAQALVELIAGGSKCSETDGERFYSELGDNYESVAMPLQCAAGKLFPKVTNQLTVWADSIQPSSSAAEWKLCKIGFYGAGYRAVTSMAFSPEEASERGLL